MPAKDITDLKIGVLGGGQLGRMMIQSAINYNLDISILDPDENAPCAHLVKHFSVGKLTDHDTVYKWGQNFDLITIEIENVSVSALKQLKNEGVTVYPQPEIIELIQDKRKQKTFYKANRIPTSDFVLTENAADVANHQDMLPGVNKLGTEGYDGRGVQMIRSEADLPKAFDKPGLLEKLVDFERELSVVVARNEKGEMDCFPVVELSYHPEQNLVEFLFAPAQISSENEEKAYKLAKDVIEKLDMVGLLAVEMFLTKEGDVLVNEVAPRTHNSGHHTIEANRTSQFEQHLRAILNMPLGSTELITPAAMVNLLGEDGFTGNAQYEGMEECMAMNGVYVHLYGKKLTKPFRKMGHVTITDDSIQDLKSKARKVKDTLKVKA
ncbi:5-(carboxyamino)imidazole ribonucleotide synthase [Ekhidna lutea]|uniref:N5-carboxyaminoimidazole ribonucleotide synthase n=1 Tax=Ekhidna lutea TaxID=447679 RepID=A0A239IEK7_EKHLU|nr:5-(carboxyamino)imidazole ribonucleotide synthase [Ekhidna lutea]SNS92070.1 5-(carboxyamino)imidazole ribonucleotide synthase [Ekhidna lutea]